MSVIGNTYPTLIDLYKRQDPNSKIATIIELLSETNEILEDATAVEGNLPTGHRTTVRTGLPDATWRKLYGGVQPTKSTAKQIDDACGMLEAYAQVDKALADLNGNTSLFRLSESKAHMEGMNNTMASTLFYGNTAIDPEKFMGLAPRFESLSAETGAQIVSGGGTGSDNTSMWFVTWDESTCHLIYPKGSAAGLRHNDLGEVTHTNADGSMYQVYRDHFKWDVGLSVRDWRYISRIANINVPSLSTYGADADSSTYLPFRMIEALNKLQSTKKGKIVIYCNRIIKTALDKMAYDKSAPNLFIQDIGGKPVTAFMGYPIRLCDAILSTEAAVS